MSLSVLQEAVALAEARVPFVLATVVWRRGPSSGQQGSKAVILADGTVRGWLGGACAEPTVVVQAREALLDGEPRLLLLGDVEDPSGAPVGVGAGPSGTYSVPMACENDGALEVYLEPVPPRPQLVVIGRSPAVAALALMGRALEWDVAVIDDSGSADEHPLPELVRTSLDLAGLGVGVGSAVVVATQGHYDDLALEAALATDAAYVGLIAGHKRADAVVENLRGRGVSEEDLARVQAPAGLDLGRLGNRELAVAIMADLVTRRASGELSRWGAVPEAPETAIDPVCSMTVLIADAKYHSRHDGADYWFCAPGCKKAFEADPAAFL
ncbi:MAG: YHS domain-containing protein [Acidimicrobiia bacterium]|nr:YHS domain-containing protein [Acidimicrobiia bacterium]MYC44899.1 YHS domain-containing protein [Acidimicrobiia bacterium]